MSSPDIVATAHETVETVETGLQMFEQSNFVDYNGEIQHDDELIHRKADMLDLGLLEEESPAQVIIDQNFLGRNHHHGEEPVQSSSDYIGDTSLQELEEEEKAAVMLADRNVPGENQYCDEDPVQMSSGNIDDAFIGKLESSFRNSLSNFDIPITLPLDASDQSSRRHLIEWMIKSAKVEPNQANEYGEIFLMHGLTTQKRLAKRIKRTNDILQILGINEKHALSIISALKKSKLLDPNDFVVNASASDHSNRVPKPSQRDSGVEHTPVSEYSIQATLSKISSKMQQVIDANDSSKVEPMAKDICREIIDVAGASAEMQAGLGSKSVCEDLVSILTIYTSTSSRVVQNALCAMSVLCRRNQDDKSTECLENVKKLGEVRACQCAIAAIRKYDDSLIVIKWGTSCVRNLSSLDANRALFSHTGASLAFMQICHKYKNNEDIHRWIFRALGKLSRNSDNRTIMVHHGFCELVLEVMTTHLHSPLLLADSCWALRAIASGDESCRSKLVQLRACEVVADVLKEHFRIDIVVTEASRALLAFVKDSDDTLRRLILAGRLNVFVLPLLGTEDVTQYTSSTQTTCCGERSAIACLVALYSISNVDFARAAFFDCGAFEAIVSVLNHYPASSEVAVWACKCVHRLSSSQIAQSMTRKSKICESLIQLLRSEMVKMDPLTAEWVGLALSIVAVDKLNRENLFSLGACEDLTAVLRHHKENPDVAYRICGAIHFMSLDDNSRSQLGVVGACEEVTDVLRHHTHHAKCLQSLDNFHEGAVQASARAIGSLAFEHNVNCAHFITCGTCETVLSAAKVFQNSSAMTEFCCRAVSRLCYDDESRSILNSHGAVKCVVGALEMYPDSEAVVKHGFFALSALTGCEEWTQTNVEQAHESDDDLYYCLNTIVNALQLHTILSAEIAHTGCKVLGSFLNSLLPKMVDGSHNLLIAQYGKNGHFTLESTCRALVSCVKAYPRDEGVQLEGMKSLCRCLKGAAEASQILGSLNYIDIIVASLRRHSSNHDIVCLCFATLLDMMAVRENHDVLCSATGCESILTALKNLYKVPEIARSGCSLLTVIADNDSTRSILGLLRVTDILLDILSVYKSTPDIVGLALLALMTMCIVDIIACSLSRTPSRIQFFCQMLDESSESNEICEWLLRLIVLLLGCVASDDDLRLGSTDDMGVDDNITLSQLMMPSIIDEPRIGLDSSAPKRIFHSTSLADVCPLKSSASLNPVCFLQEPTLYIPKKTYFNIANFVDCGLPRVLGKILQNEESNHTAIWLSLECLAMICIEEFGTVAVMSEANLSDSICSCFQKFLGLKLNIEIAACKTICNISRYRDYAGSLGSCGVCGLVVPFVRTYFAESLDSVVIGCSAMAYLSKHNTNNKISLAASDACEVCSSCLHKFIFEPCVIPHILHAVKCLCSQNKFNTSQLSSRGITDFIVENLIHTEIMDGDMSLVGNVLWCLAHLPPASMKLMTSLDIAKFVMLHMERNSPSSSGHHQRNAYVAMAACDAVYFLCANFSSNRDTLADMGACKVILSLLREYEGDENVLHSALMALANLVDCSPRNREMVKVVWILKTMQSRCDSVVVVRAGLATLLGIIHDNPTYPSDLSSVSATKIMLKATFLHMYCDVVAKRGCILLALLASHDRVYQKLLGAEGACDIAFDIISAHRDNVVVIREACWALCSLSHKHDINRDKIIRIGGIEVLTSILKMCSGNEPVVLWACGTLANIAGSKVSSNSSKFLEMDVCTIVVEILQMYMDGNEPVLRYVCWAIGNLASVPSLSERLGESGACEGIVLVLMKHVGSEAMAQLACTAIWNLGKLSDNKKRLEDAGAIDAIDMAMSKHCNNSAAMKWILKAKATLVPTSLFRNRSLSNISRTDVVDANGSSCNRSRSNSATTSTSGDEITQTS